MVRLNHKAEYAIDDSQTERDLKNNGLLCLCHSIECWLSRLFLSVKPGQDAALQCRNPPA